MRISNPRSVPRWPSDAYARAELMVSSPDHVFAVLKEIGEKAALGDGWADSPYPKWLLRELIRRGNPLIDLAIARYGDDDDLLYDLWARCDAGVRQALMVNEVAGPHGFMHGIQGESDDLLRELMELPDDELKVSFVTNRKVGTGYLRRLFDRGRPFDSMSDEPWLSLCARALGNPMLHEYREESRYSVAPEDMERNTVFRSIAKFLLTVPVSKKHASWFGENLYKLDRLELPCEFMPELPGVEIGGKEWTANLKERGQREFEMLLQRWRASPEEMENGSRGQREPFGYSSLRESLVSLISNYEHDLLRMAASSEDVAIRRGSYIAKQYSTPEQVREDYERDGEDFLDAALGNESLYRADHLEVSDAFDSALRNKGQDDDVNAWESRQIRRHRRLNQATALFKREPRTYLQPREERESSDTDFDSEEAEGDPFKESPRIRRLRSRMSMLRAGIKDEALADAISASDEVQEERHRVAKEQYKALSTSIQGMRDLMMQMTSKAPDSRGLTLLGCILLGLAIGYFLR